MKQSTALAIMMIGVAALVFGPYVSAEPILKGPPAAELPVPPSVPPVKVQGDQAALNTLIEIGCKRKADLAVVLFAAREEGMEEALAIDRIKKTIKTQLEQGATLSFGDELDFYRMTRDIFRKTRLGNYKVPVESIEAFAWTEYRGCVTTYKGCALVLSSGVDGPTQCLDGKY